MIILSKIIPVIIHFLSSQLPKLAIYSHIPSIASYPLLQIAQVEQKPCYTLEDQQGCTVMVTLECWSAGESNGEVIQLTDAVLEVILKANHALAIDGMQVLDSSINSRHIGQNLSASGELWRGLLQWHLGLKRR